MAIFGAEDGFNVSAPKTFFNRLGNLSRIRNPFLRQNSEFYRGRRVIVAAPKNFLLFPARNLLSICFVQRELITTE